MSVNVMSVKSIDVNNQAPVIGSGGFFSNAKIKRFNEFYIKIKRLNSKGMEERQKNPLLRMTDRHHSASIVKPDPRE